MQEIFNIALIGKAKKSASPALKVWMRNHQLDDNDLWSALLIDNRKKKAGYIAHKSEAPISKDDSSKEDTLIVANQFFKNYLFLDKMEILEEIAQLMQEKQKKLAYDILPLVIKEAVVHPKLKQLIFPLLGNRGHWLIQQQPKWKKAFEPLEAKNWENGNNQERVNFLIQLRTQKPEDGLSLLVEDWATETPKLKVLLLQCLKKGLSLSDESFLETCLSEKKKEIRDIATALLTALNDSSFVQRNLQRFESFCTIKKGIIKSQKLQFDIPDNIEKSAINDGINPRSKVFTGQIKANYLGQTVANIHPEQWLNFFNTDAKNVVSLFSKTDWAQVLFEALIISTKRVNHIEFTAALFDFWVQNDLKARWQQFNTKRLFELSNLLTKNQFNELAINILKKGQHIEEQSTIFYLLSQTNIKWSPELALLFFKNFKKNILDNKSNYWSNWHYKNMLKQAAFFAPYKSIVDANYQFTNYESAYNWKKDIDQFFENFQMRNDFYKAIK